MMENCVSNVIIAGDINAHHIFWNDDGKQNNKGTIIADIIN